jgi:Plasmid pRiA4b ORF-3-like protein
MTPSSVVDSAELADAAMSCPPLAGARKLAGWVGSGRPLTGSGELRPGDAAQACRDLGIELPRPKLRSAKDVQELQKYWSTALASGLIVVKGRQVAQAERGILDAWFSALTWFLELDGEDPCPTCLIVLHALDGAEGPLDLEELVARVEAELEPEGSDGEDREDGEDGVVCPHCGGIHGADDELDFDGFVDNFGLDDFDYDDNDDEDTVEHLVTTLSAMLDFGAATTTVESVALTTLGHFLVKSVIRQYSPSADADVATVASAIDVVPPALILAVAEPWLAARSASDGVEQLLAFAESAVGRARIATIVLARELGNEPVDVWREWAKRAGFGAYARLWLAAQGEPDAEEPADAAWLIVDAACIMADGLAEELPPLVVRELVAKQFGGGLVGATNFMRVSGHPRADEIAEWIAAPDERWSPEPGTPVYQLKITLRYVNQPAVWRQVLVPAGITVDDLHDVIQDALGWEDDHMHSFSTGRKEHDPDSLLSQVLAKPKDKLLYTYDFGDDWEHDVVLEKVLSAEAEATYPSCIAGCGACPPEDCGGASGYAALKVILADPSDEEYPDRLEWLGLDDGKDFDPAEFSLAEVNERLNWFIQVG